jgi:hypothetical protein
MEDQKQIGAHGGGIPPGWDFPDARPAAEEGLDLSLLDSTYKQSIDQCLKDAAKAAKFVNELREAGIWKYGI